MYNFVTKSEKRWKMWRKKMLGEDWGSDGGTKQRLIAIFKMCVDRNSFAVVIILADSKTIWL